MSVRQDLPGARPYAASLGAEGDSLTRSPPSRRRAPVSHTPPSSSSPAPVRAITYTDHRVHSWQLQREWLWPSRRPCWVCREKTIGTAFREIVVIWAMRVSWVESITVMSEDQPGRTWIVLVFVLLELLLACSVTEELKRPSSRLTPCAYCTALNDWNIDRLICEVDVDVACLCCTTLKNCWRQAHLRCRLESSSLIHLSYLPSQRSSSTSTRRPVQPRACRLLLPTSIDVRRPTVSSANLCSWPVSWLRGSCSWRVVARDRLLFWGYCDEGDRPCIAGEALCCGQGELLSAWLLAHGFEDLLTTGPFSVSSWTVLQLERTPRVPCDCPSKCEHPFGSNKIATWR